MDSSLDMMQLSQERVTTIVRLIYFNDYLPYSPAMLVPPYPVWGDD